MLWFQYSPEHADAATANVDAPDTHGIATATVARAVALVLEDKGLAEPGFIQSAIQLLKTGALQGAPSWLEGSLTELSDYEQAPLRRGSDPQIHKARTQTALLLREALEKAFPNTVSQHN